MKRTITAIAAAGFLVATVAPALAGEGGGGGCGRYDNQSVSFPQGDRRSMASGAQSTPTTQTASSTTVTTTATTKASIE